MAALFQLRSWREPWRALAQTVPKRRVQTVSEEGDEDMRFNPMLELVIDRAKRQVSFEILGRGLQTSIS